jgi:hypothetical protein
MHHCLGAEIMQRLALRGFGALLPTLGLLGNALADSPIDYKRDIRPILSDNCYSCHGNDQEGRKANLRMDRREDAFKEREGYAVIIPGKPDESELISRIKASDPEEVMPPPHSGKKLSPDQVALLERWIAEGAKWEEHWAFLPPTRPAEPAVNNKEWPKGPIDRFVLARIEGLGLAPNPEAEKTTLIRRVTLDLTGLPPTPGEVDAFLADSSPTAYETLVDRLLQSPRYGEHMARFWLDAARYGDTHGLHLDNYREIWPYRDYVINAFNTNKPFDEFVVEQLAGDLLPNPTLEQKIATGYNRCHVSTSEGGSIEEEVYVRNVTDQVDTNGTVFLGLTMGCARCHNHKYDPITSKDYYGMFAYFNSIDGPALDGNAAKWAPIVQVPTPEQALALAKAKGAVDALRGEIATEVAKVPYDNAKDAALPEFIQRKDYVWVDDGIPAGAKSTEGGGNAPWSLARYPEVPVLSGETSAPIQAQGLRQLVFESANPPLVVGEGDVLFAYVWIDPLSRPKSLMLQWHSDGWKHRAFWGEDVIPFGAPNTTEKVRVGDLPTSAKWVRLEVPAAKVGIAPGTKISGLALTQHDGTAYWDKAGVETYTPQDGQSYETLSDWVASQRALKGQGLPNDVKEIVNLDRSKRSADQVKRLTSYFVENAYSATRAVIAPLQAKLAQAQAELTTIESAIPTTLVYKEMEKPKPAFLLDRGEYDRKKDEVGRATPGFLPAPPADAPKNRLGLARWMVSPENPLVARVIVNRLWQQVFGTGIVKTAEDLGSQGEPPSHPELIDWLAVEFRESGWNVKKLMKSYVTSAAYRQSAKTTPEKLAKDPANRFLARGPRFRLDAETLRDQALFASGLLVEKVGGPSVKPPQPAGLWEAVGYTSSNTAKFVADTAPEKVFRRSMYTFWKRTSAPPQMTTFDAPSREACTVRRERTNTPLQALLLMNEPQFVEASRALAERALREGGSDVDDRLALLFALATSRRPEASELAELGAAYRDLLAHYRANADAARKLLQSSGAKVDAVADPADLAAWTMLGNIVLNLDEVVTRG